MDFFFLFKTFGIHGTCAPLTVIVCCGNIKYSGFIVKCYIYIIQFVLNSQNILIFKASVTESLGQKLLYTLFEVYSFCQCNISFEMNVYCTIDFHGS